jgi:FkbM family methyltransferase
MTIITTVYKKTLNYIGHKVVSSSGGLGLGKYTIVRKIGNILLSPVKSTYAEVLGNKMYLDERDSLLLSINGIYEKFETDLVIDKIKENDVVIDIGANIGYYTLIFAKLVGKNGKVIAFEPDPSNFKLLKKNIQTNGYKNVVLVQKAVSTKNDVLKLFLCDFNYSMHRIYDSKYGEESVDIESVNLDDYLEKNNLFDKVNFVKMDIEGSEISALGGMEKLLNRNSPLTLLTEFAPGAIVDSGNDPTDLPKLLTNCGFKLYDVKSDDEIIEKTSFDELMSTYAAKKRNHTNLLCTK